MHKQRIKVYASWDGESQSGRNRPSSTGESTTRKTRHSLLWCNKNSGLGSDDHDERCEHEATSLQHPSEDRLLAEGQEDKGTSWLLHWDARCSRTNTDTLQSTGQCFKQCIPAKRQLKGLLALPCLACTRLSSIPWNTWSGTKASVGIAMWGRDDYA